MFLVLPFLAALILARPGSFRLLAMGTRLVAVALLLALTLATAVFPSDRAPAVALIVALLVGLLVISPLPDPSEGQQPRPDYRWSPFSAEPTSYAIALTCWMLARDMASGSIEFSAILPYLFSLAVLASVHRLRLLGSLDFDQIAQLFWVFTTTLLVIASMSAAGGWQPCRPEKCSPVGRLYVGIFASENGMAIFFSFALALTIFSGRDRYRWIRAMALAAMLLATGSRTAVLCLLLVFGASRVLGRFVRKDAAGHLRLPLATSVSVAAGLVFVSGALLLTATESSLSGRGRTWTAGLKAAPIDSLVGRGSSQWVVLQELGELPHHFPHSEVLHLHFSGGWIATILWAAFIGSMLHRATGSTIQDVTNRLVPALLLAVFGLTEVIWNPATVDALTVLVVTALLLNATNRALLDPAAEHDRLPVAAT